MNVSSVSSCAYSFKSAQSEIKQQNKNDNPVSAAGEKAVLAKAGVIAGLGFGCKMLFELFDGDFAFEQFFQKAKKIVSKQKNLSPGKRFLKQTGVFAGLSMMFIGAAAALYTLFKAPEINYEGNINAFKHKKDMDVYIKGNSAEKSIYEQMNKEAVNADAAGKDRLRGLYMQMKAAKNQTPDFIRS